MAQPGCSVPLYAVLFHPVYSVIAMFGKFTLQSTAPFMQTLSFQFAAGCAGEAVFAERVLEPREVVDHARADGVVVSDTEGFGIPCLDLSVPKRNRQSRRSCRTWLVAECRHVPKEAETLLVADHLIAFGAPLVGRRDECSTGDDVVVADVSAGPGHAAAVRCHTLRIGKNSFGQCAETLLAGIWLFGKTSRMKPVPFGFGRVVCGIIDRNLSTTLVHPV